MGYFSSIQEVFKANVGPKIANILGVDEKDVGLQIGSLQGSKVPGYVFNVMNSENTISSFTLIQMPGCCGIVISTAVFVYTRFRKKGIGTMLNAFRLDVAKILGYTVIYCTDVASNEPQLKILKKNEWKIIDTFKNRRTGNTVHLHVHHL